MIAQFSLRLLLGMALAWAVLPRREITSGFFRIQLLLALALSVLAAVSIGSHPGVIDWLARIVPQGGSDGPRPATSGVALCVVLALLSFSGSVAWTLERRSGGTLFLFAILTLALFVQAIGALGTANVQGGNGLPFLASEYASAAALGSCVTGMLLGHWYLTAPTMSIAPLGRANTWFGACVGLRALLSVAAVWLTLDRSGASVEWTTTHQVWLVLRWLAGIVLPLILCVMTARILKYRNTQAATGVLFAAVILVFLGELAGMLLSRELGVPM